MKHAWIMDVLTDLKEYARVNDMPVLASQLDDIRLAAALELVNRPSDQKGPLTDAGPGAGGDRRATAGGNNP